MHTRTHTHVCTHAHTHTHMYAHTQEDAGLWGALMIFLGLVGATIAGLIIDCTKKFKEVAVITLAMAICFHSNNTGNHQYPVGASIQPKNLSYMVLFSVALMSAVYLFFVLVFPPRYQRVEAEKRVSFEKSMYVGGKS